MEYYTSGFRSYTWETGKPPAQKRLLEVWVQTISLYFLDP